MKKFILALLLLLPTAALANTSPQGYWNISPNCFAYSDMVWSDNSPGQALITMVHKDDVYYIALTATSTKWTFRQSWINSATVQFLPSGKIIFAEVHGVPPNGRGSDPMVITMVEATPTTVSLLRNSAQITVNDGTGTMTLPITRVGDALDGIRECVSQ